MGLFGFLATPLGWLLRVVYGWVNDYFLAIFLFTLFMRIILFPLSLQSQKKQSERIRLAPRLERLQQKYKDDPQKLQKKQQALYEKEGVSLTGGCLPLIVQMIVLFAIIAVIYKPLTYLSSDVPNEVVTAAINAVNVETYTKDDAYTVNADKTQATITVDGVTRTVDLTTKLPAAQMSTKSYYSELKMMQAMEQNHDEIIAAIVKDTKYDDGELYYDRMNDMRGQFTIGRYSLLQNPWNGWNDISLLWLIPLLSGLTAVLSSVLSMHYSKQGMSQEKQPGQGCSNTGMLLFMPLFSVYIAFTVPGGVGVYWICSNLIALLQTFVLNIIYNPKKIREQAEIDYLEARRRRAQEKKNNNTLAEARRRDDEREQAEDEAAAQKAAAEAAAESGEKKTDKKAKKLGLEIGEVKKDKK